MLDKFVKPPFQGKVPSRISRVALLLIIQSGNTDLAFCREREQSSFSHLLWKIDSSTSQILAQFPACCLLSFALVLLLCAESPCTRETHTLCKEEGTWVIPTYPLCTSPCPAWQKARELMPGLLVSFLSNFSSASCVLF